MIEPSISASDMEETHLQSSWRHGHKDEIQATSRLELVLTAVACLEPVPLSLLAYTLEDYTLEELKDCIAEACEQGWMHQTATNEVLEVTVEARENILKRGSTQIPTQIPEELSQASPITIRRYLQCHITLDDAAKRQALARLCLLAGQSAAKLSKFTQALTYVRYGIELLGDEAWDSETYDCSLALHNAAAEMLMVEAQHEAMEEIIDTILKNVVNEEDSWLAKATRLQAMGASGDENAAIDYGLDILEDLGEKLPRKGTLIGVVWRLMMVKRLIAGKTDDELMAMKPMTDPRKLACMRTINTIVLRTIFVRASLLPVVGAKFIELTLRHGMSAMTPNAFACCSLMLGKCGDLENSARLGRLSVRLLDQLGCIESLPRVYAAYYGSSFAATNHRREALPKLMRGYEIGMQTGDIEFACMNSCLYCLSAFEAGVALTDLKTAWEQSRQTMDSFRQEALLRFSWASMQAVYAYIGRPDGGQIAESPGHDEVCQFFIAKHLKPMTLYVRAPQMVVAYIFDDPEFPYLQTCLNLSKLVPRTDQTTQWMCALWLLKLARSGKVRKRRALRYANITLAHLKRLVKLCPINFLEKVFLLEAEVAALRHQPETAVSKYLCCAAMAHKSETVFVEAMANERVARYMLELERADEARQYMLAASNCYRQWGANAKVQHLLDEFSFLVDS